MDSQGPLAGGCAHQHRSARPIPEVLETVSGPQQTRGREEDTR